MLNRSEQNIPPFSFCLVLSLSLFLFPFHATSASEKVESVGPFAPEEGIKHFELHPALDIELVAAEPQVIDPVAIRFDEKGRLWVVEMSDYPNGPREGEKPASRIRVLDDEDGDGFYEKSTIFADHLLFATGIQPWKKGVIVTYGGTVTYFRDTNGDDKVDEKEIWFTGFMEKNPQLRANHPTFGLDNEIYIANGLRGGKVIARKEEWKKDAKPVDISGMDFRFNALTGHYESISGLGQFGLTFDNYGNRFICTNRNPCRHVVLDNEYIKRNPYVLIKETMYDVSPAGIDSRIYPISQFWTTSNLHAGQFTACCGVTIYRGNQFPEEFHNNSFTCDPTGNLIHRDVLHPQGATFDSHYGREKMEFLATKDQWCRMVNMENGPDGNLYVVDMYRAVIEHPQFVPEELKNRPDSYYGNDRGRIYRIVNKKNPGQKNEVDLSGKTPSELVPFLGHSNSWQRETAARLLYEKQDASIVPDLTKLALNGKNPLGQIHALWALRGLKSLPPELLVKINSQAGTDENVSIQILKLSEQDLPKNKQLQEMVTHPIHTVRPRLAFQQALTLDLIPDKQAKELPLYISAKNSESYPWLRKAIVISLSSSPVNFLRTFYVSSGIQTFGIHLKPGHRELFFEVSQLVGSRAKKEEIEETLALLPMHNAPEKRLIIFSGLAEGLSSRGQSVSKYIQEHPETEKVSKTIDGIFQQAIQTVFDSKKPASDRIQAIRLLRFARDNDSVNAVVKLATDATEISVQNAALGTLISFRTIINDEQSEDLLELFPSQPPAVRRAILDLFLSHPGLTSKLLDSIEDELIASTELDINRIKKLTAIKDPEIQKRVKVLLKDAIPEDRSKVLKDYQSVLSLKGDEIRGREIFKKSCTTCHKIGELGVDVGPDISDSRVKTPVQLLTSILDPNQAIDNNYFSYSLVKTNGQVVTGIIVSETASSITMRQPEGKMESVLRQDIDELRSNGVSLMPVGLEKDLDKQKMADLISFIKNWRYMDGSIPFEK